MSRSSTPAARTPRRWLRDLRRAVSWHRRKLAVVAAMAAVLTGLTALAPPDPPSITVVRAERDLPAGAVVSAEDVAVERLPEEAVPRSAIGDPEVVIGALLAAPVPEGQVLTATALVTGRPNERAGSVIAPLRLADAEISTLLSHGDVIDVLATAEETGEASLVASRVRVVGVPTERGDTTAASVGTGAVVLVEVDRRTATGLAEAAVVARLSVIWR